MFDRDEVTTGQIIVIVGSGNQFTSRGSPKRIVKNIMIKTNANFILMSLIWGYPVVSSETLKIIAPSKPLKKIVKNWIKGEGDNSIIDAAIIVIRIHFRFLQKVHAIVQIA